MAQHYGPRIVHDSSLVLHLDPAERLSYTSGSSEIRSLRAAITGSTDLNQLKAIVSGSTFV